MAWPLFYVLSIDVPNMKAIWSRNLLQETIRTLNFFIKRSFCHSVEVSAKLSGGMNTLNGQQHPLPEPACFSFQGWLYHVSQENDWVKKERVLGGIPLL